MNERNITNELETYLNDLSWREKKPDTISQFVSEQLGIQCDVKISPFRRKINLVFHPSEDMEIKFDLNTTSRFCDKQEINGKLYITFII